ncbi:MAG: methyltransferase domain-containing protein [Chloroflexota bacterium]|nr:methyltransferase domain-containing protein [Chloroflexia bacterium]MDQ3226823.1 methyltransferase domain-containing protein [Chloroflexota bacterium]
MSVPAARWQALWHRVRTRTGEWRPRRGSGDGICLSRRHELLANVQSIEPLRVDRIDLLGSEEPLWIRHTANFERLLDNAVYDPDQEFMPYWAEIWPSGVVLAAVIARDPGALAGKHVLELGPGVGVTAAAALKAGADLVVADFAPKALALCALNTLDQTGKEPRTLRVNWRRSQRELLAAAGEGFSIVLGADVLYDMEDVPVLIGLVDRIVAPGGELWIAEPGRDPAKRFVKLLRGQKWRVVSEEFASPLPDPNYQTMDTITVHRLRRPGQATVRRRRAESQRGSPSSP